MAGGLTVTASDTSLITADARAAAVAASLAGNNATSIAVGLSLAHNTIYNAVAAYVKGATNVETGGTEIKVKATDGATVKALSVAVALSASFGGGNGVAISGGGSESTNVIGTTAQAYLLNSTVGTSTTKVGAVTIEAVSTATIEATVAAVAAAVAVGGTNGVGVAVGISVARNFIGWDPQATTVAATYTSGTSHPASLNLNDTVRIGNGYARQGDVYQYIGATRTGTVSNPIDLTTEDYGNTNNWKQIGFANPNSGAGIAAYSKDTSIASSGALTIKANGTETITALVVAVSAALAAGGETGVALSGAGVFTENKIDADVKAYIEGDGTGANAGITAASITLEAKNKSGIKAIAGAASAAVSLGGNVGVSVSIGLSIALNEVDGDVAAYISGVNDGLTTAAGGNVSLDAESLGRPLGWTLALTRGAARRCCAERDDEHAQRDQGCVREPRHHADDEHQALGAERHGPGRDAGRASDRVAAHDRRRPDVHAHVERLELRRLGVDDRRDRCCGLRRRCDRQHRRGRQRRRRCCLQRRPLADERVHRHQQGLERRRGDAQRDRHVGDHGDDRGALGRRRRRRHGRRRLDRHLDRP